jgi:hypothetical protein
MQMDYSISARTKTSPTQARMATPSLTLAAVAKALIVDALGRMLAWKPRLAMLLGRVVWWVFPWLKGA